MIRTVTPHSFFGDPHPDLAVILNADPDPGGKMNVDPWGSGSSLTNFVKKTHGEFSIVIKYITDYSKEGLGTRSFQKNATFLRSFPSLEKKGACFAFFPVLY